MSPLRIFVLAIFAAASALRAAPTPSPQGIEVRSDVPYADTNNPRQALNLDLPKQRANDQPLPVIVFIHGGGWRHGDRASALGRLTPYVASGQYAGVSVGYRLTDEAPFPAQIYDCKAAIRWVRANAAQYKLDADHIGLWGTSAGGHLVSLLGTSGDVQELEGDLGPTPKVSSRVACVVNYYGPEDFLTFIPPSDTAAGNIAGLLGGSAKDKPALAKAASPVTYVSADDPPFLNAHGVDDASVPFSQGVEIDAALRQAGASSVLITVAGAGHDFRSFQAEALVRKFFDLHLRGIPAEISSCTVPGLPKFVPPPATPAK